ncbi:pentapeptide repeat-containing protein [Microtetraspora malaysiensis]|uniref:pentapeptide repeat-containing protein n=1 Tax=Microtetraspora malaysiensis TaxID=161358 RepID=UPI003D8EF595
MPPEPEPEPDAGQDPAKHTTWLAMREVRATIVRLVGTHLRVDAPTSWSGADLDFTGVVFNDDVPFGDAVFSGGHISFNGAVFSGGNTWFDGAEFSGGQVSFDNAIFSGSDVWFGGAKFPGGKVDLFEVLDWSHPPTGLPATAPGLRLPPQPKPAATPQPAEHDTGQPGTGDVSEEPEAEATDPD